MPESEKREMGRGALDFDIKPMQRPVVEGKTGPEKSGFSGEVKAREFKIESHPEGHSGVKLRRHRKINSLIPPKWVIALIIVLIAGFIGIYVVGSHRASEQNAAKNQAYVNQ